MSVREALLALFLATGLSLIVAGVWGFSPEVALIVAGIGVVGGGVLFLTEAGS